MTEQREIISRCSAMIMPGVIMVITTATTIIMMIAIMVGIRGDGKGDGQVVSSAV